MADLGRIALIVAFALILFSAGAGSYAAWRGRARVLAAARNALVGAFVAAAVASAALIGAFLARDFSVLYVAEHSSRDLPLVYTVSALWSGQAGSLLLWLLVLTGMSSLALMLNRGLVASILPWTVAVLAGIAGFFAAVLVFVSDPFETHAAPPDGAGLTSSLQNPYMAIHPPLLYLGYVGLAIPFAFGMAGLLSGATDERWIVATRRWTLAAWTFLGVGILLGAKWAYEEIGWGGYYAWDPVENAALMPWLAATAYLHSVMVQEKKGMLRIWNVVLVAMTFALSIFGTFLTRSGVVSSIHSFSQSPIGAWFVGFIVVVVVFSTVLIVARLPLLRARSRLESLVSREAAFLYNNLLLVALAFTVFWGVVFPLLSEAVRGETVTVGPPYYNFFLRAFGLPLLLLMGIGPLVAWRRSSLRSLGRSLAWPTLAAAGVAAVLLLAGAGSSPAGLTAYSFSVFVLGAIVIEFARGTRARRALGSGSWLVAFGSLVRRNRRRYGGYVVHAAIVLLAIGIVGSSAYGTSSSQRLRPGEAMQVGPYEVQYLTTFARRAANADELRARVAAWRDGRLVATLTPGKNRYAAEQQVSNEVAIHSDWLRAEDLFVIAEQFDPDGSVAFKVLVNPLVGLIWVAGAVFLCGSVVAMWPDAREQRRLAHRGVHARSTSRDPGEGSRERIRILEERDRALGAISELQLDHRTGKLSDDDYVALVGPLRAEAAELIGRLPADAGNGGDGRDGPPSTAHTARERS